MKIFLLNIFLLLISSLSFGQCEDLKGSHDTTENWREEYIQYFNVDSTFEFIEADSVLIYYFSNSENETNYGMPCCYLLATKFAEAELDKHLKILNRKLEKKDADYFS